MPTDVLTCQLPPCPANCLFFSAHYRPSSAHCQLILPTAAISCQLMSCPAKQIQCKEGFYLDSVPAFALPGFSADEV
jgi:hypothetical protein